MSADERARLLAGVRAQVDATLDTGPCPHGYATRRPCPQCGVALAASATDEGPDIVRRDDLSPDDDPAHDLDGPDPFRPAAPVALDEAWRKAEQAVPDGWELWGVRRRIGKGHGPNGACEAWAGPPGIPEKAVHGYGQQPAEALLSLARKLAFRSEEPTDD